MIPLFVIGGVSPKRKRLDDNPRRCPACGLAQAYRTRVDHYANLFFIPLFRVKKGDPVIMCERCGHTFSEEEEFRPSGRQRPLYCSHCGKPLHNDFMYCPFCGRRV